MRRRRPAGLHEPRRNREPLHDGEFYEMRFVECNCHTTLGVLYIMVRNEQSLHFPKFLFDSFGILAWGSVLWYLRFGAGIRVWSGGLTLMVSGISLLFKMPSVFPCSINASSSANVRVSLLSDGLLVLLSH